MPRDLEDCCYESSQTRELKFQKISYNCLLKQELLNTESPKLNGFPPRGGGGQDGNQVPSNS